MDLTTAQALWFLPPVLPICIYVIWSDLARMKIPNIATDTLLVVFAIVGLLALPFDAYLWRWLHFGVVLALGIAFNAAGAMGGGDAKFCASAAPFIAFGDLVIILVLVSAAALAGVASHKIAKRTPIRRWTPDWVSWNPEVGKRKFPMGYPLAGSLLAYLVAGLFYGAA
ncbi:prepilin peptidase [Aestuariibius sp. 2305UL40-4]|uniref:prepilin peptidase n=1 Tax=Aestuariibius violaceus TaxID=3234132 RepID=UPI00345E224D